MSVGSIDRDDSQHARAAAAIRGVGLDSGWDSRWSLGRGAPCGLLIHTLGISGQRGKGDPFLI